MNNKKLSKIAEKADVLYKKNLLGGQCWAACTYDKATSYSGGVAIDTSWKSDPGNHIKCPSSPNPPSAPTPNA